MFRFLAACACAALVAAASPLQLRAQSTPADTAAVLLRVATQLEEAGRRELADALFAFILERYRATPSAADAELRLAALRQRRMERGGRAELIVWSTLYGLWLGLAVPAAAGAEDATPYGLGLLLGGPSGFFLSKSYADGRPMSSGQARTITFGAEWGFWQAMGWNSVGGSSSKEFFASTVVGLAAGMGAGAVVASRRQDITAGDATLVQHGARWGSWFGLASGILFDVEDADTELEWTLVGGNLGLLAALAATPRSDLSAGRVWLITAAGIAGLVAGFGVDLLLQPDNAQVAIAIPMLTSAAGLVAGRRMARNFDAPRRIGAQPQGPAGGALLVLRGSRLGLGAPMPIPALLPRDDGRRVRLAPGIRLSLFQATR